MQDSLPAAGPALPGGIGYPQGSCERFHGCVDSPFPSFLARCQFCLSLKTELTPIVSNCFSLNCSENPARNWPGGTTSPPDPHEAPGVHCLRGGVLPWCRTRSMAQTSARCSTVTRTGRRRRASEDVARETFCSTCSPRVGVNNSGYAATSGPD